MADKKLARYVTVGSVTYGPDDDVPAEVVEQIRNEKAWVSEEDAAEAEEKRAAKRKAGTKSGHRLATTVTVGGASYGPDDEISDEVAAQITNPKAWEGGKLSTAAKAETEGEGADEGPGAGPKPARNARGGK